VSAQLLLFVVVLFGAIYVFMILPQRRARRSQQELITKLGPGSDVITTGGLYGTVTEIEDGDTVLLEVAEDTEIRISKAAIVRVITGADVPEHEDGTLEAGETDPDTDNG
jgi:preprotein translocase subunit YajC